MTSRDFCYWLQGYFEVQGAAPQAPSIVPGLNANQVDMIKRHLGMVFAHEIDPSAGGPEHQAELDAIHQGKPPQIGGQGPDGTIYRC